MADFLDQASEVEMQTLQHNLKAHAARAAKAAKVQACGVCQNPRCGEEFPAGDMRIYCDARCAAEHHRLTRN